jgi:hypothetical protein
LWLVAAAALAAVTLGFSAGHGAQAMTPYRWKMRPLVFFAPSGAQSDFARQMRIFEARRQGLKDRNMAVVGVSGDNVTVPLGPRPGLGAEALRRRYGIARNEFRVRLIGKDGGVKLSSGSAVSAD